MGKRIWLLIAVFLVAGVSVAQYGAPTQDKSAAATKPGFDITASYIEACSCDMFCPCYYNNRSTLHDGMQFCRANLVLKVDKGYYKDVKLDGAKVWIATDLGSNWSTGKDSWMVANFDSQVSPAQKAALGDILGQLYPFKWEKTDTNTVAFTWNIDTKSGVAHAKMADGKGEVVLERVPQRDDPNHETVVHNLHYWNAQSNSGFRMWKTKLEAFDGQGHKFSYEGTNGFLITIHFSGQAKPASGD
ncbi:MAG TPA: DUF1326 domain-containing protein [Candidatus Acidoferrales bacterium]|nr:DUF1326 domain-containing protein [Candidatus Acidoferrales bacterium]